MKSVNYLLLSVAACCAALTASQAQTTATAVRTVSPAVQATARASKKSAAAESLPPELTNAIHTMSFSRSPEALFEAVKAQESGGKPSESERFRLALLLGD